MKTMIWVGLILSVTWLQAQAANFDCGKAVTKIEKLICADAELSKLDEELTNTYGKTLQIFAVPEALKLRQSQWIERRDLCAPEDGSQDIIAGCLKEIYQQRLAEINGIAKADLPCPELPLIKREVEKAQCLKRWLARHPLELHREHSPRADQKFCTGFYRALATASPEIRYVEPVLRTEDPSHPRLERYRQCWDHQPVGLGYDYQGLDEQAHGFRLYLLDLDSNKKSMPKEYLYEEESWMSTKNGHTQYVRVDFVANGCYLKDQRGTYSQEPRRTMPPLDWGLNALVLYHGQFHIYDLFGPLGLRVMTHDPKRQTFSLYKCNWRIPRHLLNDQPKIKE